MTVLAPKAIHFLVVDDDGESRATIVEYLKNMGHEKITEAENGAEAIRALDLDPSISFILSDWDMPMINGLTLLQRVKSNPVKAHLPFLIMTSPISQEAEKIVLAAENMVDAYLIKPFRSVALKDKIDHVLSLAIHGPQKQVVIVDDDEDARLMVAEFLQKMGFKDVLTFAEGKSALSYLQSNPSKAGLIISDWEMPEMTGIEFLRACKMNSHLESVPFLMVTSQSSIERMKVLQAARANVDQYLLKPFNSEEIRKRIELLLEKSRNRSRVQALLAEASEHVDHARFTRAQSKFEEVLQLDSEEDTALLGLGDVLIKLKGVEVAVPFYRKAVDSNPANPKGYLKLAAAYEQIGWIDKGILILQTANQLISFSAELHFHLGRLYNKKDMVEEACSEFEKTLEAQLDHKEARVMLEMVKGRTRNS